MSSLELAVSGAVSAARRTRLERRPSPWSAIAEVNDRDRRWRRDARTEATTGAISLKITECKLTLLPLQPSVRPPVIVGIPTAVPQTPLATLAYSSLFFPTSHLRGREAGKYAESLASLRCAVRLLVSLLAALALSRCRPDGIALRMTPQAQETLRAARGAQPDHRPRIGPTHRPDERWITPEAVDDA